MLGINIAKLGFLFNDIYKTEQKKLFSFSIFFKVFTSNKSIASFTLTIYFLCYKRKLLSNFSLNTNCFFYNFFLIIYILTLFI